MSTTATLRKLGPLVLGVAVLLPVGQASAHIRLITPNGGEKLEVGSTFEIRWTILIRHNQRNWDIWYSTESNTGPWTTVAMNLPPGPFGVAVSGTVAYVADRQSGLQVIDVSSCELCPADLDGSGSVDFGDILAILSAWGNKGGPEDLDGSGVVDFGDILIVLAAWGPCP